MLHVREGNILSNRQSILLVDGMALLFRAYYASVLSGFVKRTSSGMPTNAVYGFVRYLWDAVQEFQPTHVACCWDMGSKTFRTEKFAQYKANRGEPPDDLVPQFTLVKEVVESFGIPNIGVPGFEADDCIGTLAEWFREELDVYILSGDYDLLQLVHERTKVIIMKKGARNYAVFSPESLLQDRGLTARQVIDVKGLMGDSSDNYPGVKGIGEKTAYKLIQDYQSIEGILGNLGSLAKGVRTKIEEELEMLHLSRELATIRCDVPLTCTIESCILNVDRPRVLAKFEELEFKGLVNLLA